MTFFPFSIFMCVGSHMGGRCVCGWKMYKDVNRAQSPALLHLTQRVRSLSQAQSLLKWQDLLVSLLWHLLSAGKVGVAGVTPIAIDIDSGYSNLVDCLPSSSDVSLSPWVSCL